MAPIVDPASGASVAREVGNDGTTSSTAGNDMTGMRPHCTTTHNTLDPSSHTRVSRSPLIELRNYTSLLSFF